MATIMDGVKIGVGIFIVLPLSILLIILALGGSETAIFFIIIIIVFIIGDRLIKKHIKFT